MSEAPFPHNSVFSEPGATFAPMTDQNRLDSHRSLIIDEVIENPNKNLIKICIHSVNEMEVSLSIDDIDTVSRLGVFDKNEQKPRPVKFVLKSENKRDQIFHFKRRLLQSWFYKDFQLSLDQVKEIGVKMGILKRAANNAQAQGLQVFSS